MFLTILYITTGLCFVSIIYFIYQIFRNNKVYSIVKKWINEDSELYDKYSYSKIYEPNKKNWYGLKWPNEKDYQ